MLKRRRHNFTEVLALDARMVVRWDIERDVVGFAVLLQVDEDGDWRNVRLYDCSHEGRNDRHRYSREGVKEPPYEFLDGTPALAFREAIDLIRGEYERMIQEWRR
jgi:hypothetical protein